MIRMFSTHVYRKTKEISNCLWNFTTLDKKNFKCKMLVPCCWESYSGLENYRGKGEYTTNFTEKGNVRLVFKGVSHTANVFLDEKLIKTHYNAYTPFDVIAKNISLREHELKVEVDNSFYEGSVLHKENDYMSYGGITRGVELEILGDVYIKNIMFTPNCKDGRWNGKVSMNIENLSDKAIKIKPYFLLNNNEYCFESIVIQKEETKQVIKEFSFLNVKEWMMESPNLYLLHGIIKVKDKIVDDLIERVGFRKIDTINKNIFINDKKIRIKGFNRHEDYEGFGCSVPIQAMVKDLELIKDLGANSIRTCHYPNDELFLDLCDELGILVWEEHHARGLDESEMRHPNFEIQCKNCIDEMIINHYNHPSIYIWGILNECASETEYGASCYKKQLEQIASLDSSRPNTFASNKHFKDICFGYPTVVSNNMYPKWYFDVDVKEYLEKSIKYADETSITVKPFIVSEIGCGAIYGCRSRNNAKWTEEYQAETLKEQILPILECDECVGVYIWQFADVPVTGGWFDKRPRSYNNKGVVDEYRREKLAYQTVKEIYNRYSNYIE